MANQKQRMVYLPATQVPILTEADVVVVGGGTAGFIAAVASARTGAKTVMVERLGYVGGALTATYSTTPGNFGDSDDNQVIGGIGWEFVERMEKAGYARIKRNYWLVQMLPEVSKEIAAEMVIEAGVELFLHSWVSEVLVEGARIKGVIVQTKAGRYAICGKVFIDASGDADLAAWAGASFEQLAPDDLWQTTIDLVIANVNPQKVVEWANQNEERVVWMSTVGSQEGSGLKSMISLIVLEPGRDQNLSGADYIGPVPTVKLMLYPSIGRVQGSVEINPLDVKDLTWAEIEARRRGMQHLAYLKRTVAGFEEAIVIGESHLGVRESRRVIGDYVITLQDLMTNQRFPDVVALNCRALDRHMKGEAFKLDLLSGNHDIPLRALIPKKIDNLLVAGRCISCDHEAHASLRGAATCLATGHAAGCAAALAVKCDGSVRKINLAELQELLMAQGAILKTQ